ncbi:hypothetical protein [Pseudodesulfovibrio sp. zrk46]|uniref:hypothetical protein n=1 Tax=Pseudodesulfovibrio sp. zrk46 TaxID=2725288 RepID=UPI0014496352|nr:hypothetical protein [Pseudodesulfovibrio sp. zrk46]QJB56508.1 hypothetical protein HFN16_08850 [Pseudodesulfovibrio sp. zrk46]
MESFEDKTRRLAEQICEEQLKMFIAMLKDNLFQAGANRDMCNMAINATMHEFKRSPYTQGVVTEYVQVEENRGVDIVGRILVEFCFLRGTSVKMLWPEYSDEDFKARQQFTDGVIPRPLMRYFLVCVRGALHPLDKFDASPLLYEEDYGRYDALKQDIGVLLEDFKGPFGSGESAIDWGRVYSDARFQKIALELVSDLRLKIDDVGTDGFLERINQYRSLDTDYQSNNVMHRAFCREDAIQLEMALTSAQNTLSELIN